MQIKQFSTPVFGFEFLLGQDSEVFSVSLANLKNILWWGGGGGGVLCMCVF